jgi:hypothetical protein
MVYISFYSPLSLKDLFKIRIHFKLILFYRNLIFFFRLCITTLETKSRDVRDRDLARKKLGTFEGNPTISHTKLL